MGTHTGSRDVAWPGGPVCALLGESVWDCVGCAHMCVSTWVSLCELVSGCVWGEPSLSSQAYPVPLPLSRTSPPDDAELCLPVPELSLRGTAWGVGFPQPRDSCVGVVMRRVQRMGGRHEVGCQGGYTGRLPQPPWDHLDPLGCQTHKRGTLGAPWAWRGMEVNVDGAAERPNSLLPPTLSNWPWRELRIQVLPPRAWGQGQGQNPTKASAQHFPSTCSGPGIYCWRTSSVPYL